MYIKSREEKAVDLSCIVSISCIAFLLAGSKEEREDKPKGVLCKTDSL